MEMEPQGHVGSRTQVPGFAADLLPRRNTWTVRRLGVRLRQGRPVTFPGFSERTKGSRQPEDGRHLSLHSPHFLRSGILSCRRIAILRNHASPGQVFTHASRAATASRRIYLLRHLEALNSDTWFLPLI